MKSEKRRNDIGWWTDTGSNGKLRTMKSMENRKGNARRKTDRLKMIKALASKDADAINEL